MCSIKTKKFNTTAENPVLIGGSLLIIMNSFAFPTTYLFAVFVLFFLFEHFNSIFAVLLCVFITTLSIEVHEGKYIFWKYFPCCENETNQIIKDDLICIEIEAMARIPQNIKLFRDSIIQMNAEIPQRRDKLKSVWIQNALIVYLHTFN